MQFKWHLSIGFIASYILVQFFNFNLLSGLIIFLSSWLIDIDHYFWYAIESGDWNPLNAIKWYRRSTPIWAKSSQKERDKFRRGIFVFHGICFWATLAVLSFIYRPFLYVLIGVGIHMVADWVDLWRKGDKIYYKIFPFIVIRSNKNKKDITKL